MIHNCIDSFDTMSDVDALIDMYAPASITPMDEKRRKVVNRETTCSGFVVSMGCVQRSEPVMTGSNKVSATYTMPTRHRFELCVRSLHGDESLYRIVSLHVGTRRVHIDKNDPHFYISEMEFNIDSFDQWARDASTKDVLPFEPFEFVAPSKYEKKNGLCVKHEKPTCDRVRLVIQRYAHQDESASSSDEDEFQNAEHEAATAEEEEAEDDVGHNTVVHSIMHRDRIYIYKRKLRIAHPVPVGAPVTFSFKIQCSQTQDEMRADNLRVRLLEREGYDKLVMSCENSKMEIVQLERRINQLGAQRILHADNHQAIAKMYDQVQRLKWTLSETKRQLTRDTSKVHYLIESIRPHFSDAYITELHNNMPCMIRRIVD